ncbi:MAG: glutamate-5-semialdehyde dehydrogenase [Hyphomonadaceae bacterium]|nr:glutamate-5-semialdehyde dehydrogenase [Hyphomonadaceae bacterium]
MNMQTDIKDPALAAEMIEMGARARKASAAMATLPAERRTEGLQAMASAIEAAAQKILAANAEDLAQGRAKELSPALMDRLALDEARIASVAEGLRAIAELPDPVGRELARWTRPNGLDIARVSVPLGVIGIIYESRPNVTADAAALCVRSGNAVILRCGSESLNSSTAIAEAMRGALKASGLPEDAIQLVSTRDRAAVGHMLTGLNGQLDVVVPRGGKGLVQRVQDEARVPVIGHLEGLCHMYVDRAADPQMAVDLVLNAKMRRTGICGALETLLVDAAVAPDLLPKIAAPLLEAECELRGDAAACELVPAMTLATDEDWRTEYLAPILSVRIVDGLDGAIAHIADYGTGHTESIVTEDAEVAARFANEVDAGIIMLNASTQFADGGEFGMGAEIGISTGRIHARGPVGAEQLTIFKYVVHGAGQTRP